MSIILFIIVLAILVLVHELGHFLAAKKVGMRIDEFGIGFPPSLASWKPKGSETTYSINAIPFGGFVKIWGENYEEAAETSDSERSFSHQPKWAQALVLIAGVAFNMLLAWLLIIVTFMIGVPTSVSESGISDVKDPMIVVTEVLPDTPAAASEITVGDRILEVNNESLETVPSMDVFANEVSASESVDITLLRGDEIIEATVATEAGIIEDARAIGVSMEIIGLRQYGLVDSVVNGTASTLGLTREITVALYHFGADAVTGEADFSGVAGPVGIVGLVGQSAALGFVYLLMFTAVISIHLAIINMLPIPALDGGRLLFVIIEAIKGSPIQPKIAYAANAIGFLALILLMIIVTYNDIARLF